MDENKLEENNTVFTTPDAPLMEKTSPKKRWIFIALAVTVIAAIVVVALCLNKKNKAEETPPAPPIEKTTMQVEDVTPTVAKVKNPIDFAALKEKNADLYAWIKMPGTVIDYPIAQSAPDEEEDFYLHRGEDKEYLFAGTIYTQKYNAKDFSDPNTIVYGHCMLDGSMFRELHDLKNQAKWDATPEFLIYTEGHILTYRIFSAYTRNDHHILLENDFFKEEAQFAKYLEEAAHPSYGMTRECNLTTKDRIVTLETCVTADGTTRFIVSGVLIKDQPTY